MTFVLCEWALVWHLMLCNSSGSLAFMVGIISIDLAGTANEVSRLVLGFYPKSVKTVTGMDAIDLQGFLKTSFLVS